MSERAPSISELYSNGYHAAASRHERGNAMMSSEEAIASEIYYRYEKGSQAFQFAAFNNDFDDFIYLKGAGIQIENNDVYDYNEFSKYQNKERQMPEPVGKFEEGKLKFL